MLLAGSNDEPNQIKFQAGHCLCQDPEGKKGVYERWRTGHMAQAESLKAGAKFNG